MKQPRVFISYSWTSEEHIAWVGDLAERLMSDGVDVVLDQWSLEEGQDVNEFMEQMVKDSTIKRVIIVSDELYAGKADGRKGGVGTETQIISAEVYNSVDQTKFVPLLRERDEHGDAYLPVYLKSRKYIDFSDSDNFAEAYEQLIRNIFERPHRRKPPLGRAPSHLFEEEATVVTSAQKAKRFREIVTTGKGNLSAAFEDFAEEFLTNFEELRMTYSKEQSETWCDDIKSNIETARAHRNVFIDAVNIGVKHLSSEQFMPLLCEFLEHLLPFTERPEGYGSYYECSEDNYKFLCYELFLYVFSVFVKARKFAEARQLLDYSYVAPRTYGGNELESHEFTSFHKYPRSLEEECGQHGDRPRLSLMADLVHDRADRRDFRFSDVLQADMLLFLASQGYGWFPRCLIYATTAGKLELFLRATSERGFVPLGEILNLATPEEFLSLIESPQVKQVLNDRRFFYSDLSLECINIRELRSFWRPAPP